MVRRMMSPARRRARALLPAAMPAMVEVESWEGLGSGVVDGDGMDWESVGRMRLAVVVKVMTEGGRDVSVKVEVRVIVASALRMLRIVSTERQRPRAG